MVALSEQDLRTALPDVVTPQRFAALRRGAVIRRDRWGIPHIRASCNYDLFFAQGFATAQDRLFQMDFDRMRSLGRTAEYVGARALRQDQYIRRRNLERISKLDYALAGSEARCAIDAYADGINAFIDSTRALPVEYKLLGTRPQRWEPWHCVAVYKVRNTGEGTFQGKLWLSRLARLIGPEHAARLSPGCQPGSLLTVQPGQRYSAAVLHAVDELRAVVEAASMLKETDCGSNAWAVSGERTESGLPLVAGDSHRGLEAPNVYYQVHLMGFDFAIAGFALPGFPMALHFCHNEFVCWGMTYGGIDTQDLFVERFRETDGQLEYLSCGEWHRARRATETIGVRDGQPRQIEIVETHHGPVIAGEPRLGAALTLADPGSNDATPWIDCAYRAMKARSADELEAALEGWTDRVNNYIYADKNGNYGHALKGRVPVRGSENGWGPVPGWDGLHEWHGYIPRQQLPRIRNPSAGWVVSCNQRVVDGSYPYYLSHFSSTAWRAERIASRLSQLAMRCSESGQRISAGDMVPIHGDVVSLPARAVRKALARVAGFSEKATIAAATLLEWDGSVTTEGAAPVLYEVTSAKLVEQLMRAHYGVLADDYLRGLDAGAEEHWRRQLKAAVWSALERDDISLLTPGTTWDALLASALEAAAQELEARFGTERAAWRWAELHRTSQQHVLAAVFPQVAALLNPPRIAVPGDGDTPFVAAWRTGQDFDVTIGPVNRYIYDPAQWENSRWIVPLGASGHPGSVHYADQQQLWANAETNPQLWNWDAIGEACESEQELLAEDSRRQ